MTGTAWTSAREFRAVYRLPVVPIPTNRPLIRVEHADVVFRTEAEVLAPVLEAEVLLLDDLGAGRTTAWAQDVMHDVLAHRYNRKLPTLMTTNRATGDDDDDTAQSSEAPTLKDRLGEALMSRIYEMCRVIPVIGEDYRRCILHAKHRF